MLRQKFDFWNGNESVNHVFANLKPRFPRGGGGGGGGVLLGIFGGGVPSGSSNPDPISDEKMSFSTLVFRPDLFSDLAFRQKLCHYY